MLIFLEKIIMRYLILSSLLLFTPILFSQEGKISKEIKIRLATHFLSEVEKADARVLGYSEQGEIEVLRESSNHLTCVYDDPNNEGLEIICYHSKLEDFMLRGRDLRSEGKSSKEVRDIRGQEIEDGVLSFPEGQSILYVFTGKEENVDIESATVKEGRLRYVVYVPYATQSSTGLPLSPSMPGMPWLMDPGTHRAHIMITPI